MTAMKKALFLVACVMAVAIFASSCQTGYSKASYISKLEEFVTDVDENWKTYTEDDWAKADARMAAFEEKYEKYADDFTKEEESKVSKLMTRYGVVRLKGKVKTGWENLTGYYEVGKGLVEGTIDFLGNLDI